MTLRAKLVAFFTLLLVAPLFAQTERDVINSYNRGNEFKAAFKYAEADQEYQRCFNFALRVYGEEHKNTAMLFHAMADLYEKQGKFEDAEKYYSRGLKIREKLNGPDHADVAVELAALATVLMERNKPDDAEKALARALQIREKQSGEESVEVADALNDMAILASRRGNAPEAEKLYRRSLIIREKTDGPNSLVVAQSLSNLGLALHDLEQFKDAEDAQRRALAIREKVKGPDDPLAAESVNNLALLLRDLGRYQEAEDLNRRALKIRETALGVEHVKTASTVNNLAILCMDQGRYVEAGGLFRRALAIYVKTYGADHPTVAETLNNLGLLERQRGRLADAERVDRQALAIAEQVFGPNHEAVAGKLNNLASLLSEQAKYADAELLYRRALKIRETVFGTNHNLVGDSLNNLANLASERGRPADAKPLLERAYKIREAAFGPEHPAVAEAANNLAIVLGKIGERKAAEALLKKNLANVEKAFGKEHPAYADAVFNLAGCLYDDGRFAEAEAGYREALPLFENILGKVHPHVADTLTNLGNCLKAEGKLAQARDLHQRAREIMQRAFGPEHPAVFAAMQNLAADADSGNDALALFDEQRKAARRYMLREAPFLSVGDQREFLGTTDVDQFARALSLSLETPKSVARKSAEWVANGKAMAIEARTVRTRLDRDITDPEIRKALSELIDIRAREAALASHESGPAAANVRKQRTELWVRRRLLEQSLSSSSQAAAVLQPWIELDAIRQALPKDGLLVDIVRFRPARVGKKGDQSAWDEARYVAWVIPPTGDVTIVDLGEAALIDDAVHAARRIIATSADRSREIGEAKAQQMAFAALQKVSDLVLKPLVPHLKDVNNLIVSPDGDLWLVPWAALPFHDEKYLVEAVVPRLIVSSRDLVRPAASPKLETSPALVVADPDFEVAPVSGRPRLVGLEATGKLADFEVTFVFGEAGKFSVRVSEGEIIGQGSWTQEGDSVRMETERSAYEGKIVARQLRGERRLKEKTDAPPDPFTIDLSAPASVRAADGFPRAKPLPLSRLEGESAAAKLKAIAGSEPRLLGAAAATESAVKATGRPKALVLATHGFFLPAPKDEAKASDPLARCGLILAGFNKRASAGPDDEDGVLTGLDVVGLDLRGTRFVVLSACDTGSADGDSVAGLRQAFQIAGATDVLATLWPIPDAETSRLMGRFYDRLESGVGRAEMLAAAQREAIRDRQKRNGTAHPFYWAALTITGRE
jgi:tetratricopeptide (TPR) repeat protein